MTGARTACCLREVAADPVGEMRRASLRRRGGGGGAAEIRPSLSALAKRPVAARRSATGSARFMTSPRGRVSLRNAPLIAASGAGFH